MPKRWGPRTGSPAPSPKKAPPLVAQPWDQACRPPGSKPNPRSAPEGPLPRGLAPQCWGLVTPEPSARLHCQPAINRAARGSAIHSGRENRQGPPSPLCPSKAARAKALGSTLPLASALTSARPSAHRRVGRSGLPASWGLTLTLGRPLRSPSKVPGAATPGIGDPRAPAPDSPCRPAATLSTRGAAGHSGRDNGQGLPSPRRLRRTPTPKCFGPLSLSPEPSPRLTLPLAPQLADWACWPPGD